MSRKYRFILMQDETYEEKSSFSFSPMKFFTLFFGTIFCFAGIIVYILAFTPVREYIPGYTDVELKARAMRNKVRLDSIEEKMNIKDAYINNIRQILLGEEVGGEEQIIDTADLKAGEVAIDLSRSKEDSVLREAIKNEEKYGLNPTKSINNSSSVLPFFTPLKGEFSSLFDPTIQHFGVDIVAPKDETIKCTLSGTVILATWTSETGHVIGVQHKNNLISLYKHNSILLKKVGNYVKAGDPIAIIGNTGNLTTGPHLHFELWLNGNALDPAAYIAF
ncbi:MAG: M23 family metallopeptidase [Flavobacteriales bacterium]|nr:M23 family metallopeptidase [Flavobacteriales bacterium]